MLLKHSLPKKVFSKFISTLFGGIFQILFTAIFPRLIGPSNFGQYTFISTFFQSYLPLSTLNTSEAMYVSVSQRPEDQQVLGFFFIWSILIISLFSSILLVLLKTTVYQFFFPGIDTIFIQYGLIYGILHWITGIFSRIFDAQGLTIYGEIIKTFQRLFSIILLIICLYLKVNNLTAIFFFEFITLGLWFIMQFVFFAKYKYLNISLFKNIQWKKNTLDFYSYCNPLVVRFIFVAFISYIELWCLQKFGGAYEQGLWGFSLKIILFSQIFLAAIKGLFVHEMSKLIKEKKQEALISFFKKINALLLSTITIISVFILINAKKIVLLIGGPAYQSAQIILVILCIHPIFQTMHDNFLSYVYATSQTSLYRNSQIITHTLSLPLILFLLLPTQYHCLALGSLGMAIGFVFKEFFNMLMLYLFVKKQLKENLYFYFTTFLKPFLISVITLGSTSLFLSLFNLPAILFLILHLALLGICLVMVAIRFPALLNLHPRDLDSVKSKFTNLKLFLK